MPQVRARFRFRFLASQATRRALPSVVPTHAPLLVALRTAGAATRTPFLATPLQEAYTSPFRSLGSPPVSRQSPVGRIMSVRWSAAALGVGATPSAARWVWTTRTDGALPGVKVGNQWRFRK